ncbi:MAG: phosphate ABC transporter permease subunit PstC [Planctomycetaceae bacterium]|nr:phosphate ABC transporter permease subunit PstC [Gemmataceae bacterium]PHX62682.1 MAG: phosphate ABC transporter permease subunit PstC [Planctomycetaceae bacterium]
MRKLPPAPAFRISEWLIEWALFASAFLSIGITIAIAWIVFSGTYQFFSDPTVSIKYFFTGTEWTAGFEDAKYSILPLLTGTIMVAVIAAVLALPIGLISAIYLSEYASKPIRLLLKPTLELLAGIPTVVYGYFAVFAITPLLQMFIPGLDPVTNQLSGGIVVAIMILPMVASLSEDAMRMVPGSLREASYALGATKFETSTKVVVPAALSGILASFLLAISRAIGETMAVTLACGGQPKLTLDPREGLATMTGFIARIAQGDVQHGTTLFNSLFAVAAVLFVVTLAMNMLAQWILTKYRQVYQ